MTLVDTSLQEILRSADMPMQRGHGVRFTGEDPVFPTPYRVGCAAAAALGALGIAIADLRERQTGKRPDIAIDVLDAAASLRGCRYVRLNGQEPRSPEVLTGFYRVAGGRWS
jgi:hypothetical protein